MRKLQVDDLFKLKTIGDVQISQQAAIAYVESQASPTQDATDHRIMMIKDESAPIAFTHGPQDTMPRFSPDGRSLAFLSQRSGSTQIWIIPTTGGEALQRTHIRGGITEFTWMPDGASFIAVALIDEDEGIQAESDPPNESDYDKFTKDIRIITETTYKLDGTGYFHARRPQLVFIPENHEEPPYPLTHGPFRHSHPRPSSNGQFILFLSRHGDEFDRDLFAEQLYVLDLLDRTAPPRPLTPPTMSVDHAIVHPNNEDVFFIATQNNALGYDNPLLYKTSLRTSHIELVTSQWDRPLSDVALTDMPAASGIPLSLSEPGDEILTLSSMNGLTRVVAIDIATGTVTPLTPDQGVSYSFSTTSDHQQIVMAVSSPIDPSVLFIWDRKTDTLTSRWMPNQLWRESVELPVPEPFTYRVPSGPEVEGWVLKPTDFEPEHTYPAVLEIHGGPMMMYGTAFFFEFQWLAALGYAVIYTNPRGSKGYGHEFCEAIRYQWGHLDYQDIMAGLDKALTQNTWIDRSRLAVMGGSYGGYMTNWIVAHDKRFKAPITMRSVTDWRAMVGTSDVGWHWIRRAKGTAPWSQDQEWYRQQSPITYVENIQTPMLIEHQENDLRCPIEQAEILYTALKYLNQVPVKFIRYPGESHGMSRNGKPWHRLFRLKSYAEWLAQHLDS